MTPASPKPIPARRSAWVERVAYYLVGVAIGLFMLGMFWQARSQAARRQATPFPVPAPVSSAP